MGCLNGFQRLGLLSCVVYLQVLKEPKDVAQQRRDEEAAANAARSAAAAAKADARTKMKGKNKPTRRQKKKQMNIIEERKPSLKAKLAQEVGCDTPWPHHSATHRD
jgi:uncharacterized protein involved in copper resistance